MHQRVAKDERVARVVKADVPLLHAIAFWIDAGVVGAAEHREELEAVGAAEQAVVEEVIEFREVVAALIVEGTNTALRPAADLAEPRHHAEFAQLLVLVSGRAAA